SRSPSATGGQDREHHLADAVAADAATKVDQVESYVLVLELFQRHQRVGGRSKREVQLRRDETMSPLATTSSRRRASGRSASGIAGDAGLDEGLGDRPAFHHRIALDLLFLGSERRTILGQFAGRNPAISVD